MNRPILTRVGCLSCLVVLVGCSELKTTKTEQAPTPAPAPVAEQREPAPISETTLPESEMPLFPSEPIPGHPGADPTNRPPWGYPELVNYPGSVEHFRMEGQRYVPPRNPRNQRSLVKNFVAVDMTGVKAEQKETFAEPVQYVLKGAEPALIRTGQHRPPVSVVRLKSGGQRLSFKLDPLARGLYVVRLIASLETKDVSDPPKNLILDAHINDGPNGAKSHYVVRQHGTDNFYSLGEFFFHVEDNRSFEIDVGLHPDSKVDLLVHNVDVHDVLAECAKRAGKRQGILVNPETLRANSSSDKAKFDQEVHTQNVAARMKALREEFPGKSDDELNQIWRKRRDDILWNSLPRINQNFVAPYVTGTAKVSSRPDPETAADLKAKGRLPDDNNFSFGWSGYTNGTPWWFDTPPPGHGLEWTAPWRILQVEPDGKKSYYTLDDLAANKPFPGLPFDVYSWGTRFQTGTNDPSFMFPQAQAVSTALYRTISLLSGFVENEDMYLWRLYLRAGIEEYARDYAMLLCRLAYDLPTYGTAHELGCILTPPKQFYWRLLPHQALGRVSYQFIDWQNLAVTYDHLFNIIKDNQELADAVGRHVPWVKKPGDVVELLDTYLLQYGAKQMVYFQHYYDHEHAAMLARMAAIQNDPKIAEPWVKMIFRNTWEYPHAPASIEDFIFLSTQRDGTSDIGSYSYTMGGGLGARAAKWLDYYIRFGGDRQYSLSDPNRFPRVVAGPFFPIESRVAGMHPLGVGDVGGPCTQYAQWFDNIANDSNIGWQWTRDPKFAYCVLNYGKRVSESDAEWNEMVAATNGLRNPFMANRSRVFSDWGGILEGGTQSDDFRFRHAARVRVGTGVGHAHADSLDLGLWSQGLIASGDCGARGGYGRPGVDHSFMHNVVTVDGKDWMGHTWISDLADMDGCQYLRAQGNYQKLFARQVALIELDQGKPATQPPSNPNLGPGTKYDPNIALPRAYFLDVFRVIGGKEHSYNFHGPTDDEFNANVTREALRPDESQWMEANKQYVLPGEQWGGMIGAESLTTTWRMTREAKTFEAPDRGKRTTPAAEPAIMGTAYDPASPRKYLRVQLLGQAGKRMATGIWVSAPSGESRTDGEMFRQIHVTRAAEKGEAASLFAAIWQPYAGEPFIKSATLEGNADDPASHAAVRVETVDGVRDLCFADALGAPLRTLNDGTKVQAQFAYVSRDAQGLRQASIVGGTTLETDSFTIKPGVAEWRGRVTEVNHLTRKLTLDRAFPARVLDHSFFQVGCPPTTDGRGQPTERWTSFEAVQVEPHGTSTSLEWRKGADVFSGKIEEVKLLTDTNGPLAEIVVQFHPQIADGARTQLTATNEKKTRFWRCDVAYNKVFLYGSPVTAGDFKVGERILLYEFGPGDVWRAPSKVSLRRERDGTYQLQSNTPCEITVRSSQAEWSTDGKKWSPLPRAQTSGHQSWVITESLLQKGSLLLRWPEHG